MFCLNFDVLTYLEGWVLNFQWHLRPCFTNSYVYQYNCLMLKNQQLGGSWKLSVYDIFPVCNLTDKINSKGHGVIWRWKVSLKPSFRLYRGISIGSIQKISSFFSHANQLWLQIAFCIIGSMFPFVYEWLRNFQL